MKEGVVFFNNMLFYDRENFVRLAPSVMNGTQQENTNSNMLSSINTEVSEILENSDKNSSKSSSSTVESNILDSNLENIHNQVLRSVEHSFNISSSTIESELILNSEHDEDFKSIIDETSPTESVSSKNSFKTFNSENSDYLFLSVINESLKFMSIEEKKI